MLKIYRNTALKQYNTFRIRGKGKYFIEVTSKQQLRRALAWAKKQSMPFFILGGGSNVLFSDSVYNGLIIRIANNRIKKIRKNNIIVGAGMPLPELEKKFLQHSWTGLEWSIKIPGTVGGAVYGNAGAFGREMKDSIKKVITINPYTFKEKEYSLSQCKFSYRESIFKKNHEIIWEVVLKTREGKRRLIQEKRQEHQEYKIKKRHLFEHPSAGSVFRNVFIKDTPYAHSYHKHPRSIKGSAVIKGKRVIIMGGKLSVGWLIEQCGLKGKKKGEAMISEFHANVIMNLGKAKAKDVLYLINLCKKKVWKKFKINLKEEIIVIHY